MLCLEDPKSVEFWTKLTSADWTTNRYLKAGNCHTPEAQQALQHENGLLAIVFELPSAS